MSFKNFRPYPESLDLPLKSPRLWSVSTFKHIFYPSWDFLLSNRRKKARRAEKSNWRWCIMTFDFFAVRSALYADSETFYLIPKKNKNFFLRPFTIVKRRLKKFSAGIGSSFSSSHLFRIELCLLLCKLC